MALLPQMNTAGLARSLVRPISEDYLTSAPYTAASCQTAGRLAATTPARTSPSLRASWCWRRASGTVVRPSRWMCAVTRS